MPDLQFKGKEFVYNHHLSVPFRPLVSDAAKSIVEKGKAAKLDGNLIVHGDNLHALKALLPMYAGKVDCIFIDPPYNTGNEGWCYSDGVNAPYIKEWLDSNPVNKDDMLRHDKWLTMMYPRLRLLHELLADTGIIFVCIGDDEQHRLRNMLDEIFGEEQFLACFVWQSRAKPVNMGLAKYRPQNDAEYIFAYEKTKDASPFGEVLSGEDRTYPQEDADGKYRTATILTSNRGDKQRETMRFEIGGYTPNEQQRWKGGKEFITDLYDRNRIEFKDGTPFVKYYEHEENAEHKPFYCYVSKAESGTAEIGKTLLNKIVGLQHGFDTVKPLGIVEYMLMRAATRGDELILDSFAGSGTTAHAVLDLNNADGGNRKFILVEGEDYADRLTAERVRRVMQGYKFTGKHKTELLRATVNFTAFKNSHKLMAQVDAIENLHGHEYDKITKTIKDDTLLVVGEKDIQDKVDGLGGTFTYCTLGEPIDLKGLLSGEKLPAFEQIGGWLFNTATNEAFNPTNANSKEFYLGESARYNVWLYYKPDLDFLKSRDAALTLQKAEEIAAKKPFEKTGKQNLVFAPAKFAPNKALHALGVEYASLPFALFKIDR